ncbi:TonB-dependent receptor domain-containing protein [Sphingobacterium puteale]|uniref:TonB-dependent receptor n=1 Tax=Sphingobacterium puteale TaxID=2420510 RepID=UPI003D95D1E5
MEPQLQLKRIAAAITFVVAASTTVYAQGSGKIAGKVTNVKTGETIAGVTVKVLGTSRVGSSDVTGNYNIPAVPAGKYTLEFSYLGFATKQITDVEIKDKDVTNLDVVLDNSEGKVLDQVVITGTFKKESIGALYAQQKNSISISDGISAEVIKKTPDKNTGEVLKRVSGASVQDNKFLVIRGLSDRYNSSLLNNSPLPSTEPDRKAFSFDIIPSSLVDNIVISKTASPDLPGDLTGGAINIKTKDFPDKKTVEFSVGLGGNTQTTFKDFYGSKRTVGNYFGLKNPDNNLPSTFPKNKESYTSLPANDKAEYTKDFKNTWGYKNLGKSLPYQNLQFIYGNSFLLENGGKLGVIGSLTYRNSESISNEIRNDFNGTSQGYNNYYSKYRDNYYRFSSSVGALANLSYINDKFKISLKNIFNQSLEQNFISREGEIVNENYRKTTMLEVFEKRMFNSVLDGEYLLAPSKQSKLTWNLSYSGIWDNEPDLRRLSYIKSVDETDPNVPFQAAIPNGSPSPEQAGKFYSNLEENIYSGGVNWSRGLNLLGLEQSVKVGVLKQYKKRNVDARVLGYVNKTADFNESRELLGLPQDQLFDNNNIAGNKLFIEDITNQTNSYEGTGDLNAGYAMISGNISEKLKATIGARVENYIEKLNTGSISVDVDNNVNNNYTDILPSLNLTYELTQKTNLRFSFSNTVARAQFRELAAFSFFDFITNSMKIGNPNLKRTKISNIDVRYEFYPSLGKLISVSGFYKDLKNPIETNVRSGSTAASRTVTFINAPKAYIAGAEIEIRHDLGIFNDESEFLKKIVFSANASLIKSEVNFEGSTLLAENKRPLYGQSPYLLNLGLQYSGANGWESSVFFNRAGRRIDVVGFGNYINSIFVDEYHTIYEAPRSLLDFQLSKKLISNKAELKLNVGNILDSKSIFYQDVDKNGKYNVSGDQLINSVKYGRNFSLSFGYKF